MNCEFTSMIDTLIFDFGDVFINLDKKGARQNALDLFQIDAFDNDLIEINKKYEKGLITTSDFSSYYINKFPFLSYDDLLNAWNYIIKDFPVHRLEFLMNLAKTKRFSLMLLSNTNQIHIDHIQANYNFYELFKSQFDSFYLSHEIHLRKPDRSVFEFIIDENELNVNRCLFIDDTTENTEMASSLGMHCWTIDPDNEDVTQLFETCKTLLE